MLIATMAALHGCQEEAASTVADKMGEPTVYDLAEIIDKNTAALGGDVALDAVRTMVKRSQIEEGDYRDIAIFATDRQGRMRVDIFSDGERVFAESFDGQRGHQWSPRDGQTAASNSGTIALSHTPQLPNHIFRLKDLVANGHSIEVLEQQMIDGVNYSVLKLTLSDGFENFLWVDSDSGLVTRVRNTRALHVDIDNEEKIIESRISDFRPVGSIIHPHSVMEMDLNTGETLVQISLLALDLNRDLPESYFNDLVQEVPDPE
ncbi:MAG: hypothetical protein OER22_13835 [Gammaproteobacteria bacterium]|nr:hypothetical protein [Gammaproteobacteria bacterium]MDH3373058.1 hypothetical protein [Gammaproteobacteria bacterium]MDH3408938.1 hypothetical protein [Gammaproteobacteria bacterium]MDH3553694.1 hypothetical protein [Gammaproteobacteria bacterium]